MSSINFYLNEDESFELTNVDIISKHKSGFTAVVMSHDLDHDWENQSLGKLDDLYFEQEMSLFLDVAPIDERMKLRKIKDLQIINTTEFVRASPSTKKYDFLVVEFE